LKESLFYFTSLRMTEKKIQFTFQARYYKLGEITASTRQIWFVLHGYGQLAQYFVRKFKTLEDHNICVIAPEGLSRFYFEQVTNSGRKNNRVGASWMTKEDRATDIENYLEYLDTVYQSEIGSSKIPVTVLGFSQGSATASRWALNGKITFDRFILWAGILPPDMNFEAGHERFQGKEFHFVYGTQDPFLTDSRFNEMKELSGKLNADVLHHTFDGAHDIDENTLLKFVKE
jgi:predicted esterase